MLCEEHYFFIVQWGSANSNNVASCSQTQAEEAREAFESAFSVTE